MKESDDVESVKDMLHKAQGIASAYGLSFGSNSFNVKIEAGGVGVAVCVMAVVVMFVMLLTNNRDIDRSERHQAEALAQIRADIADRHNRADQERAELRKRDDDFQDYISAIYQAAPELQKRIEAEKAEESK